MNLLKIFSDAFHDNWDEPALTDYETGLTLSYGALASRMHRIHILLKNLDIREGARVGVVGRNSVDWVVAYMGALTYGVTVVTLPAVYSGDDMVSLLDKAHTEVLFADPDMMPGSVDYRMAPSLKLVLSMDTQSVLASRYGDDSRYREILAGIDSEFSMIYPYGFTRDDATCPVLAPDSVCCVFYTSGTVGDPRPVMLMADNIEGNLIYGIKASLHPRHSAAVTSTTLGTVWAAVFNMMVPFVSGAHLTVMKDVRDPRVLVEAFQRVKPCRIMLASNVMDGVYNYILKEFEAGSVARWLRRIPGGRLLRNRALKARLDSRLGGNYREILVGSVPIGPWLSGQLRQAGVRFTVVYGLAECGGLVGYAPCSEYKPGTSGCTINSLVKCRVRPLDFEGLPEGIGVLEVRGMTLMKGYDGDDVSRASMTSDGWFSTGDIGSISREGDITVVGRIDTLIKVDGGYVSPDRLQVLLTEHAAVAHCIVLERDGRLAAIIHPAYGRIDEMYPDGVIDVNDVINSVVNEVNRMTSRRERIEIVEVSPEPLVLTSKGTVARSHYV